jgi:hypothetical protein
MGFPISLLTPNIKGGDAHLLKRQLARARVREHHVHLGKVIVLCQDVAAPMRGQEEAADDSLDLHLHI